jgi:hypothetical protein
MLQDDLYSLFFVNNNWYLFFRLHQLLCERLHTIYCHSQKVAEEEALCRKDRKESTAVALRLKAPSKFNVYKLILLFYLKQPFGLSAGFFFPQGNKDCMYLSLKHTAKFNASDFLKKYV